MDSFKMGDIEIIAVSDGSGNMDPLEVFVDSSTEDWSQIEIEDGTIGYVYSRFITEM